MKILLVGVVVIAGFLFLAPVITQRLKGVSPPQVPNQVRPGPNNGWEDLAKQTLSTTINAGISALTNYFTGSGSNPSKPKADGDALMKPSF